MDTVGDVRVGRALLGTPVCGATCDGKSEVPHGEEDTVQPSGAFLLDPVGEDETENDDAGGEEVTEITPALDGLEWVEEYMASISVCTSLWWYLNED